MSRGRIRSENGAREGVYIVHWLSKPLDPDVGFLSGQEIFWHDGAIDMACQHKFATCPVGSVMGSFEIAALSRELGVRLDSRRKVVDLDEHSVPARFTSLQCSAPGLLHSGNYVLASEFRDVGYFEDRETACGWRRLKTGPRSGLVRQKIEFLRFVVKEALEGRFYEFDQTHHKLDEDTISAARL